MDFEIASKAIAKRMETVLPHLNHSDQTGFIKGRYIGENIRLLQCILLEQTKMDESSGILLQIDFRKAFDTIGLEWSSICRVLELCKASCMQSLNNPWKYNMTM